jgi:ADP-heptose:LPS heptosyltransferase
MRVLVLRFSALGDLALLLPVLQSWQTQNPDLEIAMLSRSWAKPLFSPLPLRFYGAELQTKHRGLKGLWRLSREVASDFKPELIVDQHQVLRSQILRQFWRLQAFPPWP